MTHYTGHISESGIEALRAILNGKPVRTVYTPAVTVGFGAAPHEVDQLVFSVGHRDFVILTTSWVTTTRGFDYHIYEIERDSLPGRVPYFPHGDPKQYPQMAGRPHFGAVSSLEVRLGTIERIELIEARCSTTEPEDEDAETIDYDYGLRFCGSEGSMLLTTSFDSIRGAIEIRQGTEPALNELVDVLRTRLLLHHRMSAPASDMAKDPGPTAVSSMPEIISTTLLQQRVRNRMIDVLEIAASFEDIARWGTFEVINRWEDWYHGPDPAFFAEPVFSPEELRQIDVFTAAWDATPQIDEPQFFKSEEIHGLTHWQRFRAAAQEALSIFEKRGRFSEDNEQF